MSLSPQEIAYEKAHINQSLQGVCYGIIIAFYVLAVVTVFTRLISRFVQRQRYGLDDLFIIAALLTSIPFAVASLAAVKYGVGKHVITLTPYELVQGAKWNVVNVFSYTATMVFVKFSILAFLHRLFHKAGRWVAIAIWFCGVWAFLWMLGLYLGLGLQCRPFWRYWSLTDSCSTSLAYAYSGAVLDAVNDLMIFTLPHFLVWKLQMRTSKKIGVILLLSVGLIATAMGILKAVYSGGAPGSKHKSDATYVEVPALVANALEPFLAMTCACLPALPGFINWIRTEGFSSLASRFSNSGSFVSVFSKSSKRSQTSSKPNAADSSSGLPYSKPDVHVQTDVTIEKSLVSSGAGGSTSNEDERDLEHFPGWYERPVAKTTSHTQHTYGSTSD